MKNYEVPMEAKLRALRLLALYLLRSMRDVGIKAHVGVANGDHVFIFEGNLFRVDLNTEKVTCV